MPDDSPPAVRLNWSQQDPERMLLLPPRKFTQVNAVSSGLAAALLTALLYAGIAATDSPLATSLQRATVSYVIVLLTVWSLVILLLKVLKVRLQRRALKASVVPDDPRYHLSAETVEEVNRQLFSVAADPENFVLFNRIQISLFNLKNLGRIGDVGEMLQTQADNDEGHVETSYALVQGFVWAIPVLGFIGTVLGLSQAIGSFGAVLDGGGEMDAVKDALRDVAGGLATAFETTLQGLVASLVVQLLITVVKKSELEFLDDCGTYCLKHVVGRLRLERRTDSYDRGPLRAPPPAPAASSPAASSPAAGGAAGPGSPGPGSPGPGSSQPASSFPPGLEEDDEDDEELLFGEPPSPPMPPPARPGVRRSPPAPPTGAPPVGLPPVGLPPVGAPPAAPAPPAPPRPTGGRR